MLLAWLLLLLHSVRGEGGGGGGGGGYCCQTLAPPRQSSLCPTNSSCVVADLDGSLATTEACLVTDDLKFENSLKRSEEEIFDCLVANWDNKNKFDDSEQLPFYLETYRTGGPTLVWT